MDPQSPNKLIATKYCFLILGDDTSFFIFIFFFFFLLLLLLFYVIINLKIYIYYFFYFLSLFFYEFFFVFSCSGMFRNVPECSMFLILSTARKTACCTDRCAMKCTFRSNRCKDIVFDKSYSSGGFFFSFKATGFLELSFDVDCGPENDKF